MQLVQGLGKADSPTAVCLPPIVHPETTFSRQALKSICGIEWHGTRGFLRKLEKSFMRFLFALKFSRDPYKKLLGRSKAARCMSPGTSRLSQTILASVVLRISVNWASVKRTAGSSFSYLQCNQSWLSCSQLNVSWTYQNRSHFLNCLNWMAMMQAKVGPTRPPCSGRSDMPPIAKHYQKPSSTSKLKFSPGNRSMSSTLG